MQFTGSREPRRMLLQEGFATFVERPFTGVGAGQFKNYNPPGRVQLARNAQRADPGRRRNRHLRLCWRSAS